MANPITFRNVAVPDFSSANTLRRDAVKTLQSGLSGLSSGLSDYHQRNVDRNTGTALERINAISDLGSYDQQRQNFTRAALAEEFGRNIDLDKATDAFGQRDDSIQSDITNLNAFNASQRTAEEARLTASERPEILRIQNLIAENPNDPAIRGLIDTANVRDKGALLKSLQSSSDAAAQRKRNLTALTTQDADIERRKNITQLYKDALQNEDSSAGVGESANALAARVLDLPGSTPAEAVAARNNFITTAEAANTLSPTGQAAYTRGVADIEKTSATRLEHGRENLETWKKQNPLDPELTQAQDTKTLEDLYSYIDEIDEGSWLEWDKSGSALKTLAQSKIGLEASNGEIIEPWHVRAAITASNKKGDVDEDDLDAALTSVMSRSGKHRATQAEVRRRLAELQKAELGAISSNSSQISALLERLREGELGPR